MIILLYGGVIGCMSGTGANVIQYCYNTGKVEGLKGVGGVVGYSSSNTMSYCYNKGEIRGKTSVGGLVGYAGDTVTQVYHLTGTTYINNVQTDVAFNSGYRAERMKTATQFTNAVTIATKTDSVTYLLNNNSEAGAWAVNSNINDGYPYLIAFDNENIWVRDSSGNLILKWQE